MSLFSKNIVVGVSVTPEVGLEVAVVDFSSRTLLKYGVRQIKYNSARREIDDLDLFKENLSDLLMELNIPKNSEIVLNIPVATFKVNDYPAALDNMQIENAIEEELAQDPLYKNNDDPCSSAFKLPNSTIQFNKIAYIAASRNMIYEIVLIFKDLGYKLKAIDTSASSTLNALIYLERVNTAPDTTWTMLVVENNCCRAISINGRTFVDVFEEKISIGEVLGEAENYNTVINAIEPILKNMPAKYLCVVSKTNIISAKVLANKIKYSAPITYQEANAYSKEAFLQAAPQVDPELAAGASLDIIGACIYRDMAPYSSAVFNLYNRSLGDIYLMDQPPEIRLGDRIIVLSNELLLKLLILLGGAIILATVAAFSYYHINLVQQERHLEDINIEIQKKEDFLKENEKISAELFDEGTEVATGLARNKSVYSYYTIVGTEIPRKLWLTHLKLGEKTTIEGQADNLESVYAFFRSIKDYNADNGLKLQKLGLAANSSSVISESSEFDTESILTSLNADFYEFRISNEEEISKDSIKESKDDGNMPEGLEPIKE